MTMRTLLLAGLILGSFSEAFAQPPTREALEFQQSRARANLQELQDRMFQLAELIREVQPDHAARLVLGLRKAREELLSEEMEEIAGLILLDALDEAAERQRQVLFHLKELRDLLLSTDLDLLLKLERLRKMTAALSRLEKIREEEQREKNESTRLAEKDALSDQDQRLMRGLRQAQEENRKLTEQAEQDAMESAPASPAAEKLREAQGHMRDAEKQLDKPSPAAAATDQEEALAAIDEAMKAMEDEREQLRWDLMEQLRGAVMEALVQMLEKQERILAFVSPGDDLPESTRAAPDVRACADLCRDYLDLAGDTLQLIDETAYSVVMPSVLRILNGWVEREKAAFDRGQKDAGVEPARRTCASLIALLKILAEEASAHKRSGNPARGGCQGCADRGKLISELKILRHLQEIVRDDTVTVDGKRQAPPDSAAEAEKAIAALKAWEDEARRLAGRLKKTSCSDCLKPR